MNSLGLVREWFSALRDEAACHVENIPLSESREWSLRGGFISHRSQGFFTVTGLQWMSRSGTLIQQPFLDQREVGTLGFLMRTRRGRQQLLVQGKIEPGNVGFVQLAPTCQATYSNAQRLHGGDSPPFVEYFPRDASVVYDVEQSEQGTRFLYKRNRNVLVSIAEQGPLPNSHRWLDLDSLLDLTLEDYLINTDARSVLVCAPWERLVSRAPFSRYSHGFGHELMVSSCSASHHVPLEQVKARIREERVATENPTVVGLDGLPSWSLDDEGVVPVSGTSFRVRQIRVRVKGREVPAWDQPIIDSATEGKVFLSCGRIDGVLHFLFRAQSEAGLSSKVELTPTFVVPPGGTSDDQWQGKILAEVRQSEEGGRFYRDTNLYRIVDTGNAVEADPSHYWLTLGDVRALVDESGWLTNEARSALSLLLPWM